MALDLNTNLSKGLAIAGLFVGGIVVFLIMAGFVGPLLDSSRAVTENVSAANTGSTIGDTLAAALGPLIPIGVIVGVIGLAFAAVAFGKK